MRLIDADVLLEEFRKEMDKSIFEGRSVREVIDDTPTVDAVPVVRCKDCKCWLEIENGTGTCKRLDNVLFWFGTDYNDYCSFAERKDDE